MAVSVLGSVPAKEIHDSQSPVKLFGSSIEPIAYIFFSKEGVGKGYSSFNRPGLGCGGKMPCNNGVF